MEGGKPLTPPCFGVCTHARRPNGPAREASAGSRSAPAADGRLHHRPWAVSSRRSLEKSLCKQVGLSGNGPPHQLCAAVTSHLQSRLSKADGRPDRQTTCVNDRRACNIQKQQTEQTGIFSREKKPRNKCRPLPPPSAPPPKLDELCLFIEQDNKRVTERPESGPLI